MPRNRRQENPLDAIFDTLVTVPIWVGPVLAGGTYVALRFIWPAAFSGEEATQTFMRGIGQVAAPWLALVLVFVWLAAEYHKRKRRQLLEAQTGIDSIRGLSWQEFEHLVGEAYRRRGYLVEETGTSGGDGGIDLILKGHGETVLVQCKQWRTHRVGVKPVRELYGVLVSERADRAVLATCGTFTAEARAFTQGKPIQLVAADELVELVRSGQDVSSSGASPASEPSGAQLAAGVTAQTVDPAPAMTCPKCGGAMVLRTAKRGPNAGSCFWGCTGFPRCRVTFPYKEP
ncbi:MAG: restriction endonuclease [Phycisphaerales bacterium]|nr:MAG: restriction endonuclease [Phycisphaerales bacterium]